ncbi:MULTISPECIES: 50S ribosomal protein L25 [unclassified Gilliamella]|uniref:50S ribosomal protein L25 n=1 Tax=unclassified Gilliamella TaxID=2685620 RepID=UPI00080DA32A|nr:MULTISPECIES: 50S ribosomal protein L25 [Gilliamella]MCX8573954.1 50S ribosomal protein L25 [Gilliamella sp. B3831]MCX8576185.1 50S ribosomal protein L25 [Gilliamella sp. B3815]MCX8580013.1 50S ribosomal protein L25 [Gilliamella sp. B2717]MCX8588093.1 50S ribosomal protein L25 [Gilliamella sp. B3801]MCX8593093.1 50S ribosomal protein L25 [Gilliamella sp. B3804]
MFTLKAEVRKEHGKGASRRLRHAGQFPAIIYGGTEPAISVVLDHNHIFNMQEKPEFYSEVLTIEVDGKAVKAKVQAVQRHPFKPKLVHMDFVRV